MIYLIVGVNYVYQSNIGMGIVFGAYALANLGLLMAGGNL